MPVREGVERAADRGIQVAEHGIHTAEDRQLLRMVMNGLCVQPASVTASKQDSIADDHGVRCDAPLCVGRDCLLREAFDAPEWHTPELGDHNLDEIKLIYNQAQYETGEMIIRGYQIRHQRGR